MDEIWQLEASAEMAVGDRRAHPPAIHRALILDATHGWPGLFGALQACPVHRSSVCLDDVIQLAAVGRATPV